MKINNELKEYIENNIFPVYSKNDQGHNLDHIKYVIERSLKFAKTVDGINYNMVYVVAAYHDIGHYIDAKNHEKVSAEMLLADKQLKEFFTDEEIRIMADAVYDHRASKNGDPRSIYGKIVSSADRNDTVEQCLYRSYFYGKKLDPMASDQELYERAFDVLTKKFGVGGYAKFYFDDPDYEKFLTNIRSLLADKERFVQTQRNYILEHVFEEGSLAKHFKGKKLVYKNIYRIISLNNKGINLDSGIKYTGTSDVNKANNLVIYMNVFNKRLFARELDDFYVELSDEEQKRFGQVHRVEPLTQEEVRRVQSDDFIIMKSKREINKALKEYIEEYILPCYERNEAGHGINHINYVINRSFIFANRVDNINLNMVYVIAAYHDIGHYIDAKNHEKVSAEMLLADKHLKEFFTDEEIRIMADAVYDHRSKLEGKPRTVYGEIVASADKNVLITQPLERTYSYRVEHSPSSTLDEIIEESRQHLLDKFGTMGYATTKMYFEDLYYKKFLEDITRLAQDRDKFRKKYMEVNGLNNPLKIAFDETKRHNLDLSLDQVLYKTYELLEETRPFDVVRKEILTAAGIDELKYYTKMVNPALKKYIKDNIFPDYELNDGGHNIYHILEVIRRSFALNDTFKLGLNPDMIYVIAACHDRGKYIDHERHHLIAAKLFMDDEHFKSFFTDDERKVIKEAIEDHRSSKEDEPRTVYGKLISSADRNTSIDIVFIRSFFVAHERMPETNIEEYLDYTINRLRKKYDEVNPENMFYEDETYKVFIHDMRDLLKREDDFKNRYCEVNHIVSRDHRVMDEEGEVKFKKILKRK
jgi:uncharacterized protein